MQGINLAEVFCEMISGLSLLSLAVPIMLLRGDASFCGLASDIAELINAGSVALLLVVAYMIGLLVDALSLAIGEWFLDDLLCKKSAKAKDFKKFFANTPEHLLEYRDTQWAYFSTYRNLALLMIPSAGLWAWALGSHVGWVFSIVVIAVAILLEATFLKSARTLLSMYYSISKTYSE